jgi:hypothetical protein
MFRSVPPALLVAVVLVIVIAATLMMAHLIGPEKDGDAAADPAATSPRAFLERQWDLVREGDVGGLRATFTPRLRERIGEAALRRIETRLPPRDALVGLVEEVPGAPGTVRVSTAAGERLTTLVLTPEGWQADALWFE